MSLIADENNKVAMLIEKAFRMRPVAAGILYASYDTWKRFAQTPNEFDRELHHRH
ncbi:hypothetical protein D3C80_1916250 [compost metagenome]